MRLTSSEVRRRQQGVPLPSIATLPRRRLRGGDEPRHRCYAELWPQVAARPWQPLERPAPEPMQRVRGPPLCRSRHHRGDGKRGHHSCAAAVTTDPRPCPGPDGHAPTRAAQGVAGVPASSFGAGAAHSVVCRHHSGGAHPAPGGGRGAASRRSDGSCGHGRAHRSHGSRRTCLSLPIGHGVVFAAELLGRTRCLPAARTCAAQAASPWHKSTPTTLGRHFEPRSPGPLTQQRRPTRPAMVTTTTTMAAT